MGLLLIIYKNCTFSGEGAKNHKKPSYVAYEGFFVGTHLKYVPNTLEQYIESPLA